MEDRAPRAAGEGNEARNDGGGRFTDVTPQAGVDDHGKLGTSCAWVDYDNDGWLDLFVCNYVHYSIATDHRAIRPAATGRHPTSTFHRRRTVADLPRAAGSCAESHSREQARPGHEAMLINPSAARLAISAQQQPTQWRRRGRGAARAVVWLYKLGSTSALPGALSRHGLT